MTICRVGYLTFDLFVASQRYAPGLYWLCGVADVGECIFVRCQTRCYQHLSFHPEHARKGIWKPVIGIEFECLNISKRFLHWK